MLCGFVFDSVMIVFLPGASVTGDAPAELGLVYTGLRKDADGGVDKSRDRRGTRVPHSRGTHLHLNRAWSGSVPRLNCHRALQPTSTESLSTLSGVRMRVVDGSGSG